MYRINSLEHFQECLSCTHFLRTSCLVGAILDPHISSRFYLLAGFMILSGCNADSGGYANNRTTVMSEEIQADSSNSSEEGNFVDAAETAEPSSAADNSQKSGDLQETVKSQKQDTIESNASNGRLEITFLMSGRQTQFLYHKANTTCLWMPETMLMRNRWLIILKTKESASWNM